MSAPPHFQGKELLDSWRQGLILLTDDVGAGDIVPRLIGGFAREDRARGVHCRAIPFFLLLDGQVLPANVSGAVGVNVVALFLSQLDLGQ